MQIAAVNDKWMSARGSSRRNCRRRPVDTLPEPEAETVTAAEAEAAAGTEAKPTNK